MGFSAYALEYSMLIIVLSYIYKSNITVNSLEIEFEKGKSQISDVR